MTEEHADTNIRRKRNNPLDDNPIHSSHRRIVRSFYTITNTSVTDIFRICNPGHIPTPTHRNTQADTYITDCAQCAEPPDIIQYWMAVVSLLVLLLLLLVVFLTHFRILRLHADIWFRAIRHHFAAYFRVPRLLCFWAPELWHSFLLWVSFSWALTIHIVHKLACALW